MRFGAERAKRNAGRNKPFANTGDGFNILKLHGVAAGLEIHKVTQIDRPLAADKRRIFLPAFIGPGIAGMLHRMDQLAIKSMAFTRPAIAEKAANRQNGIRCRKGFTVHVGNARRDTGQAEAGNT